MKKQLLIIPATFALTVSSLPLVGTQNATEVLAATIRGEPVTIVKSSATNLEITVTDSEKNLKEVRTEIYKADGVTMLGQAVSYKMIPTSKSASVVVKEDFSKNSIYKALPANTKLKAKVIITRNDESRAYKFIDFTVNTTSATANTTATVLRGTPVTSLKTTNDGFIITASDDEKNLKEVRTEIYKADGVTALGTSINYKLTPSTKEASVSIKEVFAKNAIYNSLADDTKLKAKVIITRNDGTRAYKMVDFVYKKAVTSTTTENVITGKPVTSTKVTNDGFTITVSDDQKNLKEVHTEIWDVKGEKFVAYAQNYNSKPTSKSGNVIIKEDFTGSTYTALTKDTAFKAKVIITRNDGTRAFKFVDFTVKPSAISKATITTKSTNVDKNIVFTVKATRNNLKEVRTEIWDSTGKKYIGAAVNYKQYPGKPSDTVTVTEDFTSVKSVYTQAGNYKAKVIAILNDGTRTSKDIDFKVSQKAIDAKVAAQSSLVVASSFKQDQAAYFTVSSKNKDLKEVRLEIWDSTNKKYLGNGLNYKTYPKKASDKVSITEAFTNAKSVYTKAGTYSARVIATFTNGKREVKTVPFTVSAKAINTKNANIKAAEKAAAEKAAAAKKAAEKAAAEKAAAAKKAAEKKAAEQKATSSSNGTAKAPEALPASPFDLSKNQSNFVALQKQSYNAYKGVKDSKINVSINTTTPAKTAAIKIQDPTFITAYSGVEPKRVVRITVVDRNNKTVHTQKFTTSSESNSIKFYFNAGEFKAKEKYKFKVSLERGNGHISTTSFDVKPSVVIK